MSNASNERDAPYATTLNKVDEPKKAGMVSPLKTDLELGPRVFLRRVVDTLDLFRGTAERLFTVDVFSSFQGSDGVLGVKVNRGSEEHSVHVATLQKVGEIETTFGVRSLAVDPVRRLLLCASLVNNRLDVIDLRSERTLARHTLGPGLRRIWLDVEDGTAFVSSRYGLFRVRYTDRLPSP